MKKTLIIFCGLVLCSVAIAKQIPRPLASDQRIKIVPFQENNVVVVTANVFVTTQITFAKDEHVENIENGDMAAWAVDVQKQLPNMLFIKPTIVFSNTNMTVVTNKHTYYFHLTSAKEGEATYAVRFSYPEEEQQKLIAQLDFAKQQKDALLNSSKNPQDYNWDYSFSGARSITPLHVFDDGKFTYLQLRKGQDVPAIFAVDNPQGEESVVNFRRQGNYIVVQQIAPQFTLREGKNQVVSIFNDQAIAKIHRGA